MSQEFTQSWIQALVLAAENPFARRIKPQIDLVNQLVSHSHSDAPRESAEQLWNECEEKGLGPLVKTLPTQQEEWSFDSDDDINYVQEKPNTIATFEDWLGAIGLGEQRFQLLAKVTHTDWSAIVRQQAVRAQKSFDFNAWGSSSNLSVPCHANWRESYWEITFDTPNWLTLRYDEPAVVPRPETSALDDMLVEVIATAEKSQIRTKTKMVSITANQDWIDCLPSLKSLHQMVLEGGSFASQMQFVWNCVWPVVYREQNILRGKADINCIRKEIAQSLQAEPSLTLWMFLFAKLVYQIHAGYGIGFLADFRD